MASLEAMPPSSTVDPVGGGGGDSIPANICGFRQTPRRISKATRENKKGEKGTRGRNMESGGVWNEKKGIHCARMK